MMTMTGPSWLGSQWDVPESTKWYVLVPASCALFVIHRHQDPRPEQEAGDMDIDLAKLNSQAITQGKKGMVVYPKGFEEVDVSTQISPAFKRLHSTGSGPRQFSCEQQTDSYPRECSSWFRVTKIQLNCILYVIG